MLELRLLELKTNTGQAMPNQLFERTPPRYALQRRSTARWASKMHTFAFAIVFSILTSSAPACADDATRNNAAESPADSGIGYKSVSDALESLKAKPGVNVNFTKPDNWTIISEGGGIVQWSFVPPGHYSYPAVVRREIKTRSNGDVYIETRALCQAEKSSCDKLLEEFKELTEKTVAAIRKRVNQSAGQQ